MKDYTDKSYTITLILVLLFGLILGLFWGSSLEHRLNNYSSEESGQFIGQTPVKIYQVYDKDTGVYYAITETGGICVMQTMNDGVKLVDQGEPPIIHKNKG